MSDTSKPAESSDYSWALGPKPIPPVDGTVRPAANTGTGQPAVPNTAAQPAAGTQWTPTPSGSVSGSGLPGARVTQPGSGSGTAPQVGSGVSGAAGAGGAGAQPSVSGPYIPNSSQPYVPGSAGQPVGASRSAGGVPPVAGGARPANAAPAHGVSAQSAPAPHAPAHGVPAHGAAAGQRPVTSQGAPGTAPVRTRATNAAGAPVGGSQAAGATSGGRVGLSQGLRDGDVSLDDLLRETVAMRASDLHLTRGAPPMIRRDGGLRPLEGRQPLDGESLRRSVYQILTQKQRERFEDELELDFAYQVPGGARFRVNLYQQRDNLGAAFRVIPFEIKPLEELGVPAVVGSFANLPRGLVLVTGPTGSGKSTTLASIIDLANRNRPDHIMTVEDPIEFLHEHKRSIVNQREVGEDTKSFASALKHVLRQDPDIILVGEMRDLETISVALTAAETGHLVFATLHTQDAAQTIDRVIDVFPPTQQDQVRVQLAATIQGIVCQTLCKRADGPGRVVATEIMVATPAIRNLIREGKTHQIYSAMQAGASDGMHSMDQHLADLTKQGLISYETGLEKCQNVADFNRLTGRGSSSVGAGIANMGMGGNLEGGGSF